jgi:hypothetical protein
MLGEVCRSSEARECLTDNVILSRRRRTSIDPQRSEVTEGFLQILPGHFSLPHVFCKFHLQKPKSFFLENVLARISEFYGIVILMYWFDVQKHRKPHFHARYQGKEAVYDLAGNLIVGDLGRIADKIIKLWCNKNAYDIRKNWRLATEGKESPWITPLQ